MDPRNGKIASKRRNDKSDNSEHLKQDVVRYFSEYCSRTSIHGLQYLTEKRTWYERIWWIIFCMLSISACIYMISEIYMKWLRSPVLVSFATRKTPIYEIPFPAVTICPKVKIDKTRLSCFNLTDYVYKKKEKLYIGEEEEKYAAYMEVLCDEELTESTEEYININDFYHYIIRCEPKRTANVMFLGQDFKYNFQDLFKPLYTEEGICYTFNRLRMDEIYRENVVLHDHRFLDFPKSSWNSETGYDADADIETYPRRALLANMKNGLGIYFFEDKRNIDYGCDPVLQGYTVTLHIPSRFPGTREEFFFVPINSAVLAPIEGHMTLTSEKVKNYPPHKRDCYFPSERRLKYFRDYTSKNCKLECLTDHLLKMCGCVKFFMPRNESTKVCGPGSIDCADEIEVDSKLSELKNKLGKEKTETSFYDHCDCLPMCNDIVYTADAAPLGVDNEKISSWLSGLGVLDEEFENNPNILTTFLMLYMKDEYIETTERNELYGPTDFLSNFGGLMGLFTGFSMLSFIEIVYFLSLRIIGNIDLFRHWAGIHDAVG